MQRRGHAMRCRNAITARGPQTKRERGHLRALQYKDSEKCLRHRVRETGQTAGGGRLPCPRLGLGAWALGGCLAGPGALLGSIVAMALDAPWVRPPREGV